MPSIRIVTWNSKGENLQKAEELEAVQPALDRLYPIHPDVDIYLIQEACQKPGGDISVFLNNLQGFTVSHISESWTGGQGYICATRDALITATPLALYNYCSDLNLKNKPQLLKDFNCLNRPPAYTVLTTKTRDTVLLITWHAPRGITSFLMENMTGGALIDAYLALENSNLIQNPDWIAQAPVSLVVIAGDLNANPRDLIFKYCGNYTPLQNFHGLSNNLDHILVNGRNRVVVNVTEGQNTPSSSDHNLMSARVQW